MADNSLSPHGGELIERLLTVEEAAKRIEGLVRVPVRDQIAKECINIAYGFFSPIQGFMGRADVDSVVKTMQLASGYVWSVPIVYDMSDEEIAKLGLKVGDTILMTYQEEPLAILEVEEIYGYPKEVIAQNVYGTTDENHPGVKRTYAYKDKFLGGPVTLVNQPKINPPFDRFFVPPKEMRRRFAERDWQSVVAHQSRNVPHIGHEWLMKGAWFAAGADAVLVSAVIGEKKLGDYIDEAIVLGHDALREGGFFHEDVHMTSILLWDMRYAGPREAVFHAVVRKNLGCSHHMFGRDHAGVGSYYDPYAAHRIFDELPDLGIKPEVTLEWWYCRVCGGAAYSGLCGHPEQKEGISGTLVRGLIQEGAASEEEVFRIFRPEVFEIIKETEGKYGFGSLFVTEEYMRSRRPVMSMPSLETSGVT